MFLVQCSTSLLESVCFIILAKEIINAKIAKKRKMIKFSYLFKELYKIFIDTLSKI
jgi:hypothetical protein